MASSSETTNTTAAASAATNLVDDVAAFFAPALEQLKAPLELWCKLPLLLRIALVSALAATTVGATVTFAFANPWPTAVMLATVFVGANTAAYWIRDLSLLYMHNCAELAWQAEARKYLAAAVSVGLGIATMLFPSHQRLPTEVMAAIARELGSQPSAAPVPNPAPAPTTSGAVPPFTTWRHTNSRATANRPVSEPVSEPTTSDTVPTPTTWVLHANNRAAAQRTVLEPVITQESDAPSITIPTRASDILEE